MVLSSLALLIAQPDIENIETVTNNFQSIEVRLSPPINQPLRTEKIQIHHIGDKLVKIHLIRDIIFTPTKNDNIIGYDISVEIIDVKIVGDPKIINILANAHPEIGTISQYIYDYANEKLDLQNTDIIWASMIDSIEQIEYNAGQRSEKQQLEYQKLIQSIKNIPIASRKAILSQDMALLLSFVGQTLSSSDLDRENMLIKVVQTHERQNGLINEVSNFYVSRQTGIVHKLVRVSQSQNDESRKIITEIQLKIP